MTEPLTDEEFGELARVHHPCFEVMLKNWHPLIAKVKSLKNDMKHWLDDAKYYRRVHHGRFQENEKLKEENAKLRKELELEKEIGRIIR